MKICDGDGHLCHDFVQRLEELKKEQGENLRELERLKIDAYLQGRNVQNSEISENLPERAKSAGDVNRAISDMWMDFNLSERLNAMQLPEDIHVVSDRKSAPKITDKWTPKITVPEPFAMTVREETNPHEPRHTRASLEVEAARLKREQIENTINSNFKSRPVPAETYYPLYHDILLQSESRRRLVLDTRRKELEKMQNPPSFIEREERKKREKAEKIRKIRDDEEKLIGILSNSFRAQDVDETVLEPAVNYDELEDERQSRIKSRSELLLRSSSLPRRMKSAPVRKAKEAQSEFTIRPRRQHVVPDFKKLHKENEHKMQEAKKNAEEERNRRPKTAAPVLHSSKRAGERQKVVTFDQPEAIFRASKIGYTPETPPIKGNDSFVLRKDFVRQTLDILETELRSEQEKIKQRKKKQRARIKTIRKNLPPKANQMNQVEKLRELQQEDRKRLQEYRSMLNEIYNKVDQRPLLFTQS